MSRCGLLDPAALELTQEGKVPIVIAIAVQGAAEAGALEFAYIEVDVGAAEPRWKGIGIGKAH